MIDTLCSTSEGEAERGVLSENRSGVESLVGRSRNFVLAVVAAAGMSGCLPYVYGPSHGYYQNDRYYDNGYRSSAPTHVIKAFPLRIERIDRHNDNRGSHHHNDQRGNHRGNHRR